MAACGSQRHRVGDGLCRVVGSINDGPRPGDVVSGVRGDIICGPGDSVCAVEIDRVVGVDVDDSVSQFTFGVVTVTCDNTIGIAFLPQLAQVLDWITPYSGEVLPVALRSALAASRTADLHFCHSSPSGLLYHLLNVRIVSSGS